MGMAKIIFGSESEYGIFRKLKKMVFGTTKTFVIKWGQRVQKVE